MRWITGRIGDEATQQSSIIAKDDTTVSCICQSTTLNQDISPLKHHNTGWMLRNTLVYFSILLNEHDQKQNMTIRLPESTLEWFLININGPRVRFPRDIWKLFVSIGAVFVAVIYLEQRIFYHLTDGSVLKISGKRNDRVIKSEHDDKDLFISILFHIKCRSKIIWWNI